MALVSASFSGWERLEKALLDAFEEWAVEDINKAHWDDQFKTEKWKHSPLTIRANGEKAESPRDIYDLGNLYQSGIDSLKIERMSSAIEANWHWDAKNRSGQEYAWYVHEGWGTNDPYPRKFTDDISIAASFFRKAPGKALKLRVSQHLATINAR